MTWGCQRRRFAVFSESPPLVPTPMTTPPSHAEAGETGTDEFVGWIVSTSDHTGFRTDISAGGYDFIADEPVSAGGRGAGPTPYEYMLAAMGSCTVMTVPMYAGRKQWPLERITV